jgi:RNA polymerase sigma-70 factor, ECF subfamily
MALSVDLPTLRRASRGERKAMQTLVAVLSPYIERHLLRYPLSDDDRRDLLQATLIQVMRRLRTFRGESRFSTWLFRVTANEALMLMRSKKRHGARFVGGLDLEELGRLRGANDPQASPLADEMAGAKERDSRVRQALDELPPVYRDVVEMHYTDDLGLHEIAARLATTESAVRSRLHRARSRLRRIFERDGLRRESVAP